MLLTFGRSAFAMPPISGVVLAAGSATARAVTAGALSTTKNGAVAVVARGVTSANALRTARVSGQGATGRAVATASGRYLAGAKGDATSRAVAVGVGTTAANGSRGTSTCRALGAATATRSARPAVAGPIFARAIADAEAQNWARATALTAIAEAWVWGTFHEVGRGTAPTASSASGGATRIKLAAGVSASARAVVGNSAAVRNAAGFGVTAANVVPIAGARQRIGTVGYQDAFGAATCQAVCSTGEVRATPVLWIMARAVGEAIPEAQYAARGGATATATVVAGTAHLIPTLQVGGATLGASVTGAASVSRIVWSARGVCTITTQASATTTRVKGAGGVSLSIAVDAAGARVTKSSAGGAAPRAVGNAGALRTARSGGLAALSVALNDAGAQINPLSTSTYVIEVEVPDTLIEALVPENLVMVDAIDTLVEAA